MQAMQSGETSSAKTGKSSSKMRNQVQRCIKSKRQWKYRIQSRSRQRKTSITSEEIPKYVKRYQVIRSRWTGHRLGAKVERSKLHRVRENTQDQPGVDETKSREKTPHRTPWCKETVENATQANNKKAGFTKSQLAMRVCREAK